MQEKNVIEALKGCSIKRYVPNEWGLPAKSESSPLFAAKTQIHAILRENKIPYTIFYVGWLMEIAEWFAEKVFGDGNRKIYLTALDDVGRIAVRACMDERTLNKAVYIHGDELSQKELIETLGKDDHGIPRVTMEVLDNLIAENKKKNQNTALEGYQKAFFFDEVEDTSIHSTELYPEEKMVKMKDFKDFINVSRV